MNRIWKPAQAWQHALLALLALALVALSVPARAAAQSTTAEDAPVDEVQDSMGFGYVAESGAIALAPDIGYVYCPVADNGPILAVHPDYEAQAEEDLGVTVNSDGSWTTSDGDTVTPQYASAVIGDKPEVTSTTTLAAVPTAQVLLVRARWPNCRRLRFNYRCGGCYKCPQGCYSAHWANVCSIAYTGTQRFKLCQYTGNPWDICYEWTYYRCTATAFNCSGCGGNVLWSQSWIGWSCWTGGC